MSTPGPFDGLPWLRDLFKSIHTDGPINWEMARQMVHLSAAGGTPEANVDPLERIKLEEFARVAEMHVADVTGLTTASGGTLRIRTVTRTEWALRAMDDWKPFFEGLATSLAQNTGTPGAPDERDQLGMGSDAMGGMSGIPGMGDMGGFLGEIGSVIGPLLMSFQIGGLVSQLGSRAFGEYDPPLPRPASDEILIVPANVEAFGADWSLGGDDLRMWVLLQEIIFHAVLARPHVRERLQALVTEYVTGFDPNPSAIEEALGSIDPSRPESFPEVLGDPAALVGAVQTDRQRDVKARIEALTVPLAGYVDHVLDTIGRRLVGTHGLIDEAVRRRRVEETDGARMLGNLLGLELTQAQYDRGESFVKGVVERAGEDGLSRLWHSETELPTPAEVDAPGLWLARIDLPS